MAGKIPQRARRETYLHLSSFSAMLTDEQAENSGDLRRINTNNTTFWQDELPSDLRSFFRGKRAKPSIFAWKRGFEEGTGVSG